MWTIPKNADILDVLREANGIEVFPRYAVCPDVFNNPLDAEKYTDPLEVPISFDTLDISVRLHNCMKRTGLKTIGDVVRYGKSNVLKIRKFGRKTMNELMYILHSFGLELND